MRDLISRGAFFPMRLSMPAMSLCFGLAIGLEIGCNQRDVTADAGSSSDSGAPTNDADNLDAPGDRSDGSTTIPIPACLRDLIDTCPLEGACQAWDSPWDASVGFAQRRLCYASGMRVMVNESATTSTCPSPRRTIQVQRADRTLCYTVVFARISFCEEDRYEWSDSADNLVARGHLSNYPPYEYSIECASGAEGARCVRLGSTACLSFPPDLGGCVAGDCPLVR